MKRNLLYILLLFIIVSGCVRELGDKYTLNRKPIGKEFKTASDAYLYACGDADVINSFGVHFVDLESKIYHISKDSIKILKVGYCWIYCKTGAADTIPSIPSNHINTKNKGYKEFGDTILIANSEDDALKFSTRIDVLGYDSVYYLRSFIIAEDLRSFSKNRIDTGYNQSTQRVRTLLPQDFWIRKHDFRDEFNIQDAVSFVLNNEAYIYGGTNGLDLFNTTWKYNSVKDSWEQAATASTITPKGRIGAVSFVVDDIAYVGLGVTNVIENMYDSTFYKYESNRWKKCDQAFPGASRKDAIAFTLQVGPGTTNKRAFVGFGITQNGTELNDLYMYYQEADTAGTFSAWGQVDPSGKPSQRTGSTVTVIENIAYMCGGEYNGEYKTDFYKFEPIFPVGGSWVTLKQFPGAARANAVSFSLEYTKDGSSNQIVYVGTGMTKDSLTNDFYKYDLKTQEWSKISFLGGPGDYGEPRENAVAFDIVKNHDEYGLNILNRGFVVGGRTKIDIAVSDIWEYFP